VLFISNNNNNDNNNNNNNNNNIFRTFYIFSMPLQYLIKGKLKNLEKIKEKFTIHRINPRETN